MTLTNPEYIGGKEVLKQGSFEEVLTTIKELDLPTDEKNELLNDFLESACHIVGKLSEKIIDTASEELGRDDYKQFLIEMFIL